MLFSEVSQAGFRSLRNQNMFGRFSNQPDFIFYSIKPVNKWSCFLHHPLFSASEAPPCLRTCSTSGIGRQLAATFPGQTLFCSGRELCDSTPPGLARRRPFQTVPCSLSSSRASSEVRERAGPRESRTCFHLSCPGLWAPPPALAWLQQLTILSPHLLQVSGCSDPLSSAGPVPLGLSRLP